jgi:hypothetical protein
MSWHKGKGKEIRCFVSLPDCAASKHVTFRHFVGRSGITFGFCFGLGAPINGPLLRIQGTLSLRPLAP